MTESSRMMGLKKVVQHWGGVQSSGEFRKSLIEKVIRESQEMQAPKAAQAAAAGAEVAGAEDQRTLPPVWVLLAAAVVAVVAYYLVLWLRGV